MSEATVVKFPTGFPYELCQIFGRMMLAHRALLAQQRRHVSEKLSFLQRMIAECDERIALLDPEIFA